MDFLIMEFDWKRSFSCDQIYWICFIESRKRVKRTWTGKAWNWNKRFRDIFHIGARSYKESCSTYQFDVFNNCFHCSIFWVFNACTFNEDFECWEAFNFFSISNLFGLCDINSSYNSIKSLTPNFSCNFIIILHKLNTMSTARRIEFNENNIVLSNSFSEVWWCKL